MLRDFAERFPEHEIMFEQILVNHIFYEGFPFYGGREDIYQVFSALAAIYAVWKTAAVCTLARSGGTDELVDLTGDFFRMAEGSDFNLFAVALISEKSGLKREKVVSLCRV